MEDPRLPREASDASHTTITTQDVLNSLLFWLGVALWLRYVWYP